MSVSVPGLPADRWHIPPAELEAPLVVFDPDVEDASVDDEDWPEGLGELHATTATATSKKKERSH